MPTIVFEVDGKRFEINTLEEIDRALTILTQFRTLLESLLLLTNPTNNPVPLPHLTDQEHPAAEIKSDVHKHTDADAQRYVNFPPTEPRTVDYLLCAIALADSPQHLREVVPQMLALGWKATGENLEAIMSNLAASCHRHPDLFIYRHRYVAATETGRALAKTLPLLSLPQATQ